MAGNPLFSPIELGNITLKNRIGMSALTRNRAKDTYPTELMKEYYVQRAVGGAGLIVSEGILITRQGTEWPHAPGIWDDKYVAGWKKITDAVHEAGGKIYAQVIGRAAHPDAPEQKLAGEPVYAPSAISARGGKFRHIHGAPGYVTPTAIDDPWVIIGIHGGNGFLITQFLDNTCNKRTDQWGGNVENRSRFGLEVLKVLVEVFGRDVGVKLSPAGGYNDVGHLDTYSYFISEADKLSLSYFALMRYAEAFDVSYDGIPRAAKHDVLESYRSYIKNAKIFLNAGLVAARKIDGVFIGFNWVSHPDLAKRVLHGKPLDNIPDSDWSKGYIDYPVAVY
ncbi:flavoprotein NADH-dependent oxidoreductase [Flammula alnicola]|nr:flavoprotein NADH-dependent oxidoreductase [Flammula alnicola]